MHRWGIDTIADPHAARYLKSSLLSTLLLSFPFPSLPQAHAKEALELVHMQQQTAQVKHHEEYKVCVSAYSRIASPLFYLSLFLPRLPSPASPFPPLPPFPFPSSPIVPSSRLLVLLL